MRKLNPVLNKGEYVFVSTRDLDNIPRTKTICEFREKEGVTIVIDKEMADILSLAYEYIAHWITLNVHSSLSAVGLTAVIAECATQTKNLSFLKGFVTAILQLKKCG